MQKTRGLCRASAAEFHSAIPVRTPDIHFKLDENVPTLGRPWGWIVHMARLESQLHWLRACHCPAESVYRFAVQIEWEHICNWSLFLYMDGKGEGHHYHQKACHTEQGYIKYNVGQLEQSRWHNLWSVPPAIHASNRLSRPPCDGLCRVEHIYLAAKGFKAATEGKCHWLNRET